MAKKLPSIKSDAELEAFMERDLSTYLDHKNFRPMKLDIAKTTHHHTLSACSPVKNA